MLIKTRKQAMCDAENTYFTGKACKNGHTSYRYTQSGACKECIHGPMLAVTGARRSERIAAAQAAALRASAFPIYKFRIWMEDRETFTATAWAMAVMRDPDITLSFVDTGRNLTDIIESTGVVSARCHAEDYKTLQRIVGTMHSARSMTVSAATQARSDITEYAIAKYTSVDNGEPNFDAKLRDGTL